MTTDCVLTNIEVTWSLITKKLRLVCRWPSWIFYQHKKNVTLS